MTPFLYRVRSEIKRPTAGVGLSGLAVQSPAFLIRSPRPNPLASWAIKFTALRGLSKAGETYGSKVHI